MLKRNGSLGWFFYVFAIIAFVIASYTIFAAETPEVPRAVVPVSTEHKSLEQLMDNANKEMSDFFWKSLKSKFADEETKKVLRQAYADFVKHKKEFELSEDPKIKEKQLAHVKEIIEKIKKIYTGLQLIEKKKELIEKFNKVKSETVKLIDQLNVDSVTKGELKTELNRFDEIFRGLMVKSLPQTPHEEFSKILGSMEAEIKKVDHFHDELMAMKRTQERQDIQLQPEEREAFDLLVNRLCRDIKKYVGNEKSLLTWHAEPWERCVNAPVDLRLRFAAQIAFDVKKYFMEKEVLNITSFATGGFADGGAQLLQELTVLDAIYRVWPPEKKLIIHLALIGPNLDELVAGKYDQIELLHKESDELLMKLCEEQARASSIALSLHSYKTHRDYIEAANKDPSLKSDLLFAVDYSTFEPAGSKSVNSLSISNKMSDAALDLVFVDLKPQEQIKDSLRIYYRQGVQASTGSMKELVHSLFSKQIKSQDLDEFIRSVSSMPWPNRTPFLIELVIQRLQKFGYEFWSDVKEPQLVLSRSVFMALAFKEIIISALKPGGLIYSLQKRILLPADYKNFMLNPSFYINPGITVDEKERFVPL